MSDVHPSAIVEADVTLGEGVEIGPGAVIRSGTVLGDGVTIGEYAVLGKRPKLGPKSVAKGGELPGLVVGNGSTISTHAIVYAGTTLGERVIIGDHAFVRERCSIGAQTVIGRGVTVENDTTIGEGCRIQSQSYITAKSLLEDDVFIAPCVVTTNDNFMGRTEERHALLKGPTIRRGARIGGAVCILPGIEIGEEAFVGAGAVVTQDVPAGKVVVGVPSRVLRDVADEQLRRNGG
ncbi:MAG: N-acetyltransferase [Thermoleophilia bacterium]|nr:N-acetyltransferase [Thermoleophilia bacterium]